MQQPELNIYNIDVISESDNSRFQVTKIFGGGSFSCADKIRGQKIYMVVDKDIGGSILYVGQTIQSMQKRLYSGIRYQRYHWAKETQSYTLFVWNFSQFPIPTNSYMLDSIEAELTFAVRVHQLSWPRDQTQIKFRWFGRSKYIDQAPTIALSMLDSLYGYLLSKQGLSEDDKSYLEKQRKITLGTLSKFSLSD